ncbi:subunit Snf22 of SWI/SNF chromatin-remodeling complex, partial [Hamiltosporidium magnivora]
MPEIPHQFISNENPYSFSSTISTDPYNTKKERLESINRLQPPYIPIGIDTKSIEIERNNIVQQVKQTLIRDILVSEYNRVSCYMSDKIELEGFEEGDNNSSVLEGVSNSSNVLEGVNNSRNRVGGVNDTDSKQQGVNNSTSKQQGVNNSSSKQDPVNISTNNQQGVDNNSSKQDLVNHSSSKQDPVNNSTTKQDPVNNSTTKQDPVNKSTNTLHPFTTNTNTIPTNTTPTNNPDTNTLLTLLTSYLHSINYSDTHLLSSLTKVRKLLLHTKQQTLRTSVYKSISSSLSPSQLLSSTSKHHRNTLTDLYILNTLESKYKTEQLKKQTFKKIEISRNILETHKRIINNIKIRINITEKFYKCINNLNINFYKLESKKQEKIRRERLKALRNEDEQGYLLLLKEKKEERIEYILNKTDEYISILTERIRSSSRVGIEGVSNSRVGLEGVSNSRIELEGVSNSSSKLEGVNNLSNTQHPVNNQTNTQHPVNHVSNTQHPVNHLSNTNTNNTPTNTPNTNNTPTNTNTYNTPTIDYFLTAHLISEPLLSQPSYLKGTLKNYQLKGIEWLLSLYNNNLNGILADEMGLGKTIQIIGFISYLTYNKNIKGSYIIICPLSVISNWKKEINKWCPTLSVIEYKGIPEVRKGIQRELRSMLGGSTYSFSNSTYSFSNSTYGSTYGSTYSNLYNNNNNNNTNTTLPSINNNNNTTNIILTTYEYVVKDKNFLSRIPWFYMIIDEGHRLKNKESKLCSVISNKYKSKYRLLITGTPLQNNLYELWGLLNFILPCIFNSNKSFEEWFNMGIGISSVGGGSVGISSVCVGGSVGISGSNVSGISGSSTNNTGLLGLEEQMLLIQRLHKVLRPFLLRRLKRDVEVLPDKVERVIRVNMSGIQRYLYNRVISKGD